MRARRQNTVRSNNNDENAVGVGGGKTGQGHHPIAKLASASTAALRSQRYGAAKAKENFVKAVAPVSGPRRALNDISQANQSKVRHHVLLTFQLPLLIYRCSFLLQGQRRCRRV